MKKINKNQFWHNADSTGICFDGVKIIETVDEWPEEREFHFGPFKSFSAAKKDALQRIKSLIDSARREASWVRKLK